MKNMRWTKALLRFAMSCCIFGDVAAATPEIERANESDVDASFIVGFNSVDVPRNRILLFRSKKEICALRIDSFGTSDIGGKRLKHTDYQLNRTDVESRLLDVGIAETGRFALEGYFGLGHWTWNKGNTLFKCGGQRITWYYPNRFSLIGLSIAPTGWKKFSEVKLDDRRIQWVEEDRSRMRKDIIFTINSLPMGD